MLNKRRKRRIRAEHMIYKNIHNKGVLNISVQVRVPCKKDFELRICIIGMNREETLS